MSRVIPPPELELPEYTQFDPLILSDEHSSVCQDSLVRSCRIAGVKKIRFNRATLANFPTGLAMGETSVAGEVILKRLKESSATLADARIAHALLMEQSQLTLNFFLTNLGIPSVDFLGTVYIDHQKRRYVLRICFNLTNKTWERKKQYLSSNRTRDDRALSAVL